MKWGNPQKMSPEVIRSFTWIEQFAHFDSYDMLNRTEVSEISILDEDGRSHQYATQKIQSVDKGMTFEILRPVRIADDQPPVVYVTFVGVRCMEAFAVAWQRAPGDDCFRSHEQSLFLNNLNPIIEELKRQTGLKSHIVLIGHSLGGAYAQLGFHSLQRVINDNQLKKNQINGALNADNIASLTLGVWNAAGVIKSVADNSLLLASSLAKRGVYQRAFYGLVEGDLLQTLGQGSVLCGVSKQYAEVHLVKINRREEWFHKKANQKLSYAATEANLGAPGILASLYLDLREKADSHSNPTLHTASKQEKPVLGTMALQFEYYQNNTPEGEAGILRHLKRTFILNTPFMQWCRKGVYAMLQWWVRKRS